MGLVQSEAVGANLPLTAIRMRERMLETGTSQEELAVMVKASQGAISQILTGLTRNSRLLPKIAHSLAVNLDWLAGLSDEKIDMFDADGEDLSENELALIRAGKSQRGLSNPAQLQDKRLAFHGKPPEPKADPDTVQLTEFDVSYGMGATYIHDVPVTGRQRVFSRSWIRQFTDAPMESLFWATGSGMSNMPAILDSDILLIDTAQRTPRMWDQFWAIDMHGMGMIKALRPGKEGAMRILSINPDWPEEVAYDGEMNVIGRVVAIVRKC